MTETERNRLNALREGWVEAHNLSDLIGVYPDDIWVSPRLSAFFSRLQRDTPLKDAQGRWSRAVVESFLQYHRVMPIETACYRLGMDEASFRRTLDALDEAGLYVRNTQDFPDWIVGEELFKELHRLLPSASNVIFNNHSDYCRRVHAAIASDLGVTVTALRCDSSVALGENPPDYASARCCVSHHPIGIRHKVMLNLGKPLRLAPDVVSLRFFLQNEAELRGLVFGSTPTVEPEAAARLMA